MTWNMLTEALVRVQPRGGDRRSASLPGVLAALARDEVDAFPALRPHQRHAWHAFLAQLGAFALIRAGRDAMPEDEETWRGLLRGLTPDHPDDAPWCLVSPPDRPALLQPPIPDGLQGLKNVVATPDALDMLVTSRNHDLKSAVMTAAEPEHWLLALVSLQTTEGFLGAGNYGVSRMNGGFGNRPGLGIAPAGRTASAVRRDIEALVALRRAGDVPVGYDASNGLGLVWLRSWDGTTSVQPSELDPLYIEICRRVRLVAEGGRIAARAVTSKVPRIVPIPGGVTGDLWAPTLSDRKGAKGGAVDTGTREGLASVAHALTHGRTGAIARAATERAALAHDVRLRVLKPALFALAQKGPDQIDYRDRVTEARARDNLARFDRAVDASFFEDLWAECACTTDEDARTVRRAWVRHLVKGVAWPLVMEAGAGAPRVAGWRMRALARAETLFWAGTRSRAGGLRPFFTREGRDDAADPEAA